jgi:alpha-tubulin suppressor-like RCC1 family protein
LQILLLCGVGGCGLTLDLYPLDRLDGGVVRIDGGDIDASFDASFDAPVRVDGPVVVDATLRDAPEDAPETDAYMDGATADACECDPGERCVSDGCRVHYVGVSAGGAHTCGWTTVGSVVCWGDNEAGQLGSPGLSAQPRRVELPGPVAQVDAGDRHTCARSTDGRVFCWGANDINQISEGMGPTVPPTEVFLSGTAGQLSAGARHTLAVRGRTYEGWGANGQGQLGIGAVTRSSPPEAGDFEDPVEVAAGGSHSCVLDELGGVFCVGARNHDQLANGEGEPSPDFVAVGLARGVFRGLSTAFDHTCAIGLGDDAVRCWGSSGSGQSGRGPGDPSSLTPIENSSPAQQVSAGLDHTCAVMMDNTVRCWGSNENGQLGRLGSGGSRPANVPGLARVVQVSAGRTHTCVLSAAGGILCFGDGRRGQLGSGMSSSSTPLPVPDPID